jgi:hypothetical protein
MYLRIALHLGALASLALFGCSADGALGSGVNNECQPGEQRCNGTALQQCDQTGSFQTLFTCSSSRYCDDKLGCVDCLPNSTICQNGSAEVHSCNPDGTVGPLTEYCGCGQVCQQGACVDSCEVAASEFIYLVDDSNNYVSFKPSIDTDPAALQKLGKLSCGTTSTPYSMAVDRKARSWVLMQDGNIFFVTPQGMDCNGPGFSCVASGFTPNQSGMKLFGMGFVSDAMGSKTETLYVGNNITGGGTLGLAKIDPVTKTLTKFADFPTGVTESPEMTGTGAA